MIFKGFISIKILAHPNIKVNINIKMDAKRYGEEIDLIVSIVAVKPTFQIRIPIKDKLITNLKNKFNLLFLLDLLLFLIFLI